MLVENASRHSNKKSFRVICCLGLNLDAKDKDHRHFILAHILKLQSSFFDAPNILLLRHRLSHIESSISRDFRTVINIVLGIPSFLNFKSI